MITSDILKELADAQMPMGWRCGAVACGQATATGRGRALRPEAGGGVAAEGLCVAFAKKAADTGDPHQQAENKIYWNKAQPVNEQCCDENQNNFCRKNGY